MPLLELIRPRPDWYSALEVALTRPEGVEERREFEDPWNPGLNVDRPRRISDDLAWLRQAIDEPASHGLRSLDEDTSLPVWEAGDQPAQRLTRLRSRGVLEAAGFLLHEPG
jgi:hypothetical protein